MITDDDLALLADVLKHHPLLSRAEAIVYLIEVGAWPDFTNHDVPLRLRGFGVMDEPPV